MTPWTRPFIGIPYEIGARGGGVIDCWGLLRRVYAEHLGIAIPSYADDYVCVEEQREIEALMEGRIPEQWIEVPVGQEREFDMLLFRRGRFKDHVGVVVEPRRRFLHALEDERSSIVWYDDGKWRRRLDGVWRHREIEARLACLKTTAGLPAPAST